jgi:hypothetical protein
MQNAANRRNATQPRRNQNPPAPYGRNEYADLNAGVRQPTLCQFRLLRAVARNHERDSDVRRVGLRLEADHVRMAS